MRSIGIAIRALRAVGMGLGLIAAWGAPADAGGGSPGGRLAEGRELFLREWTPNDPRSHGGDGLGPVFNDSSCVACHNAGGPGGGGPSSKNVDIVTAVQNQFPQNFQAQPDSPSLPPGYLQRAAMSLLGIERGGSQAKGPALTPAPPARPDTTRLIEAHPGFRSARSVVLHKSSVDPTYDAWRATITGLVQFTPAVPAGAGGQAEINRLRAIAQAENNQMRAQVQIGPFELVHSQRNPTALFGIGQIDAIPDAAIEAASTVRYPDFPEVAGRVARQKDGRIGRFGWKSQTPTLSDFVLTACAVELGLEVPGHPQGGLPRPSLKTATQSACKIELAVDGAIKPLDKATIVASNLDLSADQCAALEAYIRAFPVPVELNRTDREVEAGRGLFAKVGCATCHSPKLGDQEGIYSDLLIHDMGQDLGDTGSYTPFVPGSEDPDFLDPPIADTVTVTVSNEPAGQARPRTGPATRVEWRTPPLWGVRDSSPYLHDGRAPTLERAIALHGGQGERPARAYFDLTPRERLQVQAFLKSLAAPDVSTAVAGR